MNNSWFFTAKGELVDLDFFYAFTIELNSIVLGHKTHNENIIFAEFNTLEDCKEYIRQIYPKLRGVNET